jgi:hypothetical protein
MTYLFSFGAKLKAINLQSVCNLEICNVRHHGIRLTTFGTRRKDPAYCKHYKSFTTANNTRHDSLYSLDRSILLERIERSTSLGFENSNSILDVVDETAKATL